MSDVMKAGTPNLATQELMRVSATVAADRSLMGVASSHLVDLSTAVKRYWNPWADKGRRPTKSTFTRLKYLDGTGIRATGAEGCLVTLAVMQDWHSLHQAVTSLLRPFHTKRSDTIRRVALTPGWAGPWMAAHTVRRWRSGTIGLTWLPDV